MLRWLRGRENETATDAAALDPIRIFTADIELSGSVAPSGQRITDLLLRGQDLAFLPAGAEPRPEHWVSVAAADILFVVPPPLPRSRKRVRRPRTRATTVAVGPYRITGAAFLQSDHNAEPPAFLPLTGATVAREGGEPQAFEVVIVNLAASSSVDVGDPK